jgi:KaiC/GvpD/RAD55 family RecA-like ATPase
MSAATQLVGGIAEADDRELAAMIVGDLEKIRRRQDISWMNDEAEKREDSRSDVSYTWAKDFPAATEPVMIVDGLFEAGALAVVFGDSGSGKSTFMLDVAAHVATGRTWRGRRTRKGITIWAALESSAGTRRRVAAHCKKHNVDPADLLFADVTTALQLIEHHDVKTLIATVRVAEAEIGEKCSLVVVDTLARAMAGRDENAAQDMGLLVKGCDFIRNETGATVVLIHHSGKDMSRGARGSGALRAAVDTEIEVSGQVNPRQARVTKQRDLLGGGTFAFDLEAMEIGTDPETREPFTACVVVHREDIASTATEPKGRAVTAILRALRAQQADCKNGPCIWTLDELRAIGRHLGQHRNSARDAVDRLVVSGLLTTTVGGYQLTETEQ